MSDPLPTDDPRPFDVAPHVGREEKIEQLLLAGLEHYFGGEYDQAINIWTRALFIDRSHTRARAYIERARSAQAERQRESEELLQRGVAAFERGAAGEARRLLREAMDQGAPPEEALAILDRIHRLEQVAPNFVAASLEPMPTAAVVRRASPASRAAWAALAGCGVVIVAAAAFAAGAFRGDLAPLLVRPVPNGSGLAKLTLDEGPSLPRRGEDALTRARVLARSGRLRDALGALDAVRSTDPERPEADRLRAELQKQLIAMSAAFVVPSPRIPAEP